jgi:hypothetical protein
MMAGTEWMPSVATNRRWSPLPPTRARAFIVTPVAASSGDLVALAVRLEHLERLDRRDVELAQAHLRGDLPAVEELRGGKRLEHLLEAVPEGVEVGGVDRDPDCTRMPAEADEQVGALLDRMEEVDRAHRAARAVRDAVGDGEQQRGDVEAVHETAGHDALDPLVPALPSHHDGAAAVVGGLGHGHGLGREFPLDLAALLVDGLEAARELGGAGGRRR